MGSFHTNEALLSQLIVGMTIERDGHVLWYRPRCTNLGPFACECPLTGILTRETKLLDQYIRIATRTRSPCASMYAHIELEHKSLSRWRRQRWCRAFNVYALIATFTREWVWCAIVTPSWCLGKGNIQVDERWQSMLQSWLCSGEVKTELPDYHFLVPNVEGSEHSWLMKNLSGMFCVLSLAFFPRSQSSLNEVSTSNVCRMKQDRNRWKFIMIRNKSGWAAKRWTWFTHLFSRTAPCCGRVFDNLNKSVSVSVVHSSNSLLLSSVFVCYFTRAVN